MPFYVSGSVFESLRKKRMGRQGTFVSETKPINTMKTTLLTLGLLSAGTALQGQYNKENLGLYKNKISTADSVYTVVGSQSAGSISHQWNFGDMGEKGRQMYQQVSAEEQRYTFRNLRIYMITAENQFKSAHGHVGHYLNLTEGLAKGKVKVTEAGGGVVNTLMFSNVSQDTIMILAGEVVTGGKQDRVVAKDLLLLPGMTNVQVPVFCVEQGRWTPNGTGMQFNGHFGFSAPAVRKAAVVDKNQQQVWQNVAQKNKEVGTSSSSGTYAAIANSEKLKEELDAYLKHFNELMLADSNAIGFVAVTGDTVISCDLFANNALYRSQAGSLLKASAVEAIATGAAVTIKAAEVMGFLNEFLSEEKKQEEKVESSGTILKSGASKLHMNYFKR